MNFWLYLCVYALGVATGIGWGWIVWSIERKYHK